MLRHPGPSACRPASDARPWQENGDAVDVPPAVRSRRARRTLRSATCPLLAPTTRRERALGGVYAFTAYFLWGFLPLYFLLLAPTGPFELVAWRILLSLGVLRDPADRPARLGAARRRSCGSRACCCGPAVAGGADLRQLAGLHPRRPHRPRDRDEPRLLHQPDRHGPARRARAARAAAADAVDRARRSRRSRWASSSSGTARSPGSR